MIDTTEDTITEPSVVEVDSFNEAVDPDNAIMDETGKVIQHFDREKNITYKLKGKENPLDSPKPDAAKADTVDKSKLDADPSDESDDDAEDEIEHLNPADYILKKIGYDKAAIKVGEQEIPIADLSEEQQLDIIVHEFDTATEAYESRIKELEARAPELKFDDPMAQQIVDYLKDGGDIKKLAKEIISRDPAAQAKILTDAEIVKLSIKQQFPTYTDKDVEDELAELSESQVARRSKAARADMESRKPDFKDLTDAQKLEQIAERQRYVAEFDGEVTQVKQAAIKLDKIAGIPISEEVRNYLVKTVTPTTMEEDSTFVKNLSNNPEKLLKLQFWSEYGEKVIEQLHGHYEKQIAKARNEGKQGLSDEPLKTYQSKTGKKDAPVKAFTDPGFNFDKWLNASEF